MPPETPRSTAKSGFSLTPSFAFNLGLLPSFRFTSPQRLLLMASLSPPRLFNRFVRSKEPSVSGAPETRLPELEHKTQYPSLGLPKPKLMSGFRQPGTQNSLHPVPLDANLQNDLNGLDKSELEQSENASSLLHHTVDPSVYLNISDLVRTVESVDLWSLENDSRHNATNITAIHENTSTDEFYYSPTEFLITQDDAHLESSPSFLTSAITPCRKRKLSNADRSPSEVVAAQITKGTVPMTPIGFKTFESSKAWTPALDSALHRCQRMYKDYQDKNCSDTATLRPASQNKVLSRLMFSLTGVRRSAKQISSRLDRLNKASGAKAIISPTYSNTPAAENAPISSSPISARSAEFCKNSTPLLSIREFSVAFNYKNQIQGSHFFTKLSPSSETSQISINGAYKAIGIDNQLFEQDFGLISDKLVAQNVPIFSITAAMDLKPSDQMTSTPMSPLTNPRLFTLDNGNFLTYLNVGVKGKKCKDLFLSWTSAISIYKGADTCLLKSRELVNGYKNESGDFTLEVPFLNNFWLGYLTFLTNGSNQFDELQSLYILQVIYEGDDQKSGNIHGVFTYKFEIGTNNAGNATVTTLVFKEADNVDIDDNATVLASSLPIESSPNRFGFSIDTNLANCDISPGPLTAPTYDASLLYKLNPAYEQANSRPALSRFNSVPNQIPTRSLFDPYIDTTQRYTSYEFLTLPSAGQNGMVSVPVAPHGHPTQPGMPYSATFTTQKHFPGGAVPFPYGPSPALAVGAQPGMVAPHSAPQWHSALGGAMAIPTETATSAPASQERFVARDSPTIKEPPKQTITFGPILEYDPSESRSGQPKRSKGNPSINTFRLTRQIMYKPKKDK